MMKFNLGQIIGLIAIAPYMMIPLSGEMAIAQQDIDCKNPTSGYAGRYCAGVAYGKADKELNNLYQQMIKKLKGKAKNNLITAQKAWVNFRDKNCDFEVTGYVGATGYGEALFNCLERVTKERIIELKKQGTE